MFGFKTSKIVRLTRACDSFSYLNWDLIISRVQKILIALLLFVFFSYITMQDMYMYIHWPGRTLWPPTGAVMVIHQTASSFQQNGADGGEGGGNF